MAKTKNLDEIFFSESSESCKFYSGEGGGYEAIAQLRYVYDFLSNGAKDGAVYIGNAFSLQMVSEAAVVTVLPCKAKDVPKTAQSIIGHADTAVVVSDLLGREVPMNRQSVHLNAGDVLYVAQITGGRLPEGATTLPEGFSLEFRKVIVRS